MRSGGCSLRLGKGLCQVVEDVACLVAGVQEAGSILRRRSIRQLRPAVDLVSVRAMRLESRVLGSRKNVLCSRLAPRRALVCSVLFAEGCQEAVVGWFQVACPRIELQKHLTALAVLTSVASCSVLEVPNDSVLTEVEVELVQAVVHFVAGSVRRYLPPRAEGLAVQ